MLQLRCILPNSMISFSSGARVRLYVGQHQLLCDGIVDSVGFDIKVVVVTDDKCHLVKSTSNEPTV